MATLRKEFVEQTNEVRQMMKLIVTAPGEVDQSNSLADVDLTLFEGVWKDRFTGSTFYVRLLKGELAVPYTYGRNRELTGHVYNYKIIGKTIFGRFQWFKSVVSGYLHLRLEDDGRLKGGWWYHEDVPKEVIADISRVADTLPNMNKLLLEKAPEVKALPANIEKYFRTL